MERSGKALPVSRSRRFARGRRTRSSRRVSSGVFHVSHLSSFQKILFLPSSILAGARIKTNNSNWLFAFNKLNCEIRANSPEFWLLQGVLSLPDWLPPLPEHAHPQSIRSSSPRAAPRWNFLVGVLSARVVRFGYIRLLHVFFEPRNKGSIAGVSSRWRRVCSLSEGTIRTSSCRALEGLSISREYFLFVFLVSACEIFL